MVQVFAEIVSKTNLYADRRHAGLRGQPRVDRGDHEGVILEKLCYREASN
jgi:hypothetical protein